MSQVTSRSLRDDVVAGHYPRRRALSTSPGFSLIELHNSSWSPNPVVWSFLRAVYAYREYIFNAGALIHCCLAAEEGGLRIDAEKDFHGYRAAEMLAWLENVWARRQWHGLLRVRIIHGTGEVLFRAARQWCDEKGIPWTVEPHNPGVTILHPSRRTLPTTPTSNRALGRQADRLRAALPNTNGAGVSRQGEPADKKPPMKADAASITDPMAAEFERLGEQSGRDLLRRKNS